MSSLQFWCEQSYTQLVPLAGVGTPLVYNTYVGSNDWGGTERVVKKVGHRCCTCPRAAPAGEWRAILVKGLATRNPCHSEQCTRLTRGDWINYIQIITLTSHHLGNYIELHVLIGSSLHHSIQVVSPQVINLIIQEHCVLLHYDFDPCWRLVIQTPSVIPEIIRIAECLFQISDRKSKLQYGQVFRTLHQSLAATTPNGTFDIVP